MKRKLLDSSINYNIKFYVNKKKKIIDILS